MRSVGRVLAGLAFAFAVVLPSVAWAAPAGSLDTTFDTDGMQTVSTIGGSDSGTEVLVVGGKVLVYGASDGDLLIARLTAAGAPDPGFGGGDGIVTMNVLGCGENALGWLRGLHLLEGDAVADRLQLPDEPRGVELRVVTDEVVGAKVLVGNSFVEHVVGGDQDRVAHGDGGLA